MASLYDAYGVYQAAQGVGFTRELVPVAPAVQWTVSAVRRNGTSSGPSVGTAIVQSGGVYILTVDAADVDVLGHLAIELVDGGTATIVLENQVSTVAADLATLLDDVSDLAGMIMSAADLRSAVGLALANLDSQLLTIKANL